MFLFFKHFENKILIVTINVMSGKENTARKKMVGKCKGKKIITIIKATV